MSLTRKEIDQRYKDRHPGRNAEKAAHYRQRHPDAASEASKKWRETHPETVISSRKQSYQKLMKNNPGQRRESDWRRAGIDMTQWSYLQYLAMLERQANKCRACGRTLVACRQDITNGEEVAYADHDHRTGRVRCLLCSCCNAALGHVKDNIETLKNMIALLESVKGVTQL